MYVFSGLCLFSALATTGLAALSCPAQASCTGFVGSIASALKGYPPASTFCSSRFPVPQQTCTSVAPTSTITITAASTSTMTITVATSTITDTASTVTNTATITVTPTITTSNTETATETDTITATVTTTTVEPANQKRDRLGRGSDPRSSKLKSLQSEASSFIGAVCTCLETPASTTITTTPSTTATVTATVTLSVTQTITSTVTPTVTTTITDTAAPVVVMDSSTITTMTTNTVTSTATAVRTTCTPNAFEQNGGEVGCPDNTLCSPTSYTCTIQANYEACFGSCSTNFEDSYFNDDLQCYCFASCCSS